MKNSKKISVIIPFFNAEKTLERAVNSILKQTYINFELILVNNNSTDKSEEIAIELSNRDKRIILLNEEKQGVVFASNCGMKYSNCEFIARMDADDFSFPERLEKQINFLKENSEIDAVGSLIEYEGKYLGKGLHKYVEETNKIITSEEISRKRFVELVVINPSIMFRKKSLEKYGYYENGDFPEDYELFLRWLYKGAKFAKIPEKLLIWNDSDRRLTRTNSIYSEEAFYRIKTKYLIHFLKEKNPFYPKVVIWGAGKKSRKRSDLLKHYGIEIQYYIDIDSKKIDGKKVIDYKELLSKKDIYILSYVNNHGASQKILEFLISKNYKEEKDFIFI